MKQFILKCIKCLLIPFGIVQRLCRKQGEITILMYHRVNDSVVKEISVTREDFRHQMAYLKRKGYRVIPLDEALHLAESGVIPDEKYIVLTFDDGYEDFYTAAYPVLAEFGFPALVYVVPGYVETNRVMWWDRDLGESKLMNWQQIEELYAGGLIRFGSHTLTHPDFDQINEETAKAELYHSQELLEERLAAKIRHFAYPRGIVAHAGTIQTVYDTAVSIFEGEELSAGSDRMIIKRRPVQRSDGRLLFPARLRGWLELEGWLKKRMGKH